MKNFDSNFNFKGAKSKVCNAETSDGNLKEVSLKTE